MRALRALFAAVLAALSFVVVAAAPSFACSCANAGTAGHLDGADVVVSATVVDVVAPREQKVMSSMEGTGTVTFDETTDAQPSEDDWLADWSLPLGLLAGGSLVLLTGVLWVRHALR